MAARVMSLVVSLSLIVAVAYGAEAASPGMGEPRLRFVIGTASAPRVALKMFDLKTSTGGSFFVPSLEVIAAIESALPDSIAASKGQSERARVKKHWRRYVVIYLGYTDHGRQKISSYALDWDDAKLPTLADVLDTVTAGGGCAVVNTTYDVTSSKIEALTCSGQF
jgi:hypothetical protein